MSFGAVTYRPIGVIRGEYKTADAFEMHLNEIAKYTGKLARSVAVTTLARDGQTYCQAVSGMGN